MARAPAQDEKLIRSLYARHGGALLGYLERLVGGDRPQAEDVVQETLVRAWRHADELDGETARPWLFTVARNILIDRHRARRARPVEAAADALEAVPAGDELDSALLSWEVADAMRALTPEHRRVLLELYYRGRSVKEAAAALGIPEGTVQSRSFYALRALRVALQERGVTSP